MPRPGTVLGAVIAWMVASFVLILSGWGTLTVAGDEEARGIVENMFAEAGTQISPAAVQQLLVTIGFLSMILGLLVAVFGAFVLNRRNWARIAATVVGTLSVFFSLMAIPFVLLAIVLQFLPSSNAWFRFQPGPAPSSAMSP